MSAKQREILEQLGRGEISPQEAEEKLKELQPKKGILSSLRDLDLNIDFGCGNRIVLEEELSGPLSEGPIQLDLSSANGSIKVETWDSPEYRLLIKKHVRADNQERAEEIASEYCFAEIDGNRISAGDKEYRDLHKKISVSLHLQIPVGHEVGGEIKTANGSVSCAGVKGNDLLLSSANGSVRMEDISGGTFRAKTVNGSIRIEGQAGKVQGKTTNGSINLNSSLLQGGVSLETVNGSIGVTIPAVEETAFALTASTTCGRVKIEHSQLGVRKIGGFGGKHVETRSNNWDQAANKVELELKTVNGSISIKEK